MQECGENYWDSGCTLCLTTGRVLKELVEEPVHGRGKQESEQEKQKLYVCVCALQFWWILAMDFFF